MRRRFYSIVVMLVAVSALPAHAQVQQQQMQQQVQRQSVRPDITGSVYFAGSKGQEAKAIVGASVFVRPANLTTDQAWIGPVLTDPYGRFTIDNIMAGTYLLRVYGASRTRLWEQVVAVPVTLRPIIVPDLTVLYYPKSADGSLVDKALQNLGYPYAQRESINGLPTNIIWFGDAVQLPDVKKIATALIQNGVQIRAIRRFSDGGGAKAKIVEVGASPQHIAGRVLTVADLRLVKDFPRARP